jgi:cyclic-di-GMP phosphodiesterase TipF (flagellum assembly factor)
MAAIQAETPMTNALIVVTYAMACATAAVLLAMTRLASPMTCVLFGFVLLILSGQLHAAVLRRREKRRMRSEIAGLRRISQGFSLALEDTHAKIDTVKATIEANATAQSRKIVAELQLLEGLMREFATKITTKAKEVPPPQDVLLERRATDTARTYLDTLGESGLLETIRASLEENRVDLYLQPIVSLPQRKLRFYEALSRLRAEDGSVIMPAQYMKVAAPVGLMSVVDNLLLFRCVQIVRRLVQKSREIGVFCNISGDTLTDTEFFPQFLEYMHHNRDLAHHIVFEFGQDSVLKAGAQGEENLLYLASLGFALSMDHVQSLALDFGRLKTLGFRYMKVRADILMNGMTGANSTVAAEDLKKLLERHGMNLIAERVENEKEVVQMLDYSVDFGQGYLFGEPRAVREDSFKAPDKPSEKIEPTAPVIPFRRAG